MICAFTNTRLNVVLLDTLIDYLARSSCVRKLGSSLYGPQCRLNIKNVTVVAVVFPYPKYIQDVNIGSSTHDIRCGYAT